MGRWHPLPGSATHPCFLFRLGLIVKTLRLIHAAHFSVGTGANPIAPTEDYSQWPGVLTSEHRAKFLLLTDRPDQPQKNKKPRAGFPAQGRRLFFLLLFASTPATGPCLHSAIRVQISRTLGLRKFCSNK